MLRRLLLSLALLWAVPAWADSMPLVGVGSGAASASYVGPGDVLAGARFWYGFRGYNAAYRSRAANICTPSDVTCSDINILATGAIDEASITTLGCNNSTSICTVKTLYDQTGALACAGSVACDVTQATIANRPTVVRSCLGTLSCMAISGTTAKLVSANITLTFPISFEWSALTTGYQTVPALYQKVLGFNTASETSTGFDPTVGVPGSCFVGGATVAVDTVCAINTWFAFAGVSANSASSNLNANGTTASANTSPDTAPTATGVLFGGSTSAMTLTGQVVEAGAWATTFAAGDETSLVSNARSYWGF